MTRPTWRSLEAALALGLPALGLVGIAITIVLAQRGRVDAAPDNVRRTAQVQTQDLSADMAAQRAGLVAHLVRSSDGMLELSITPAVVDSRVSLTFVHPTDASQDQVVALLAHEGRWRGHARLPLAHHWQLRLTPPDRAWRIQGRLMHDEATATLSALFNSP